MADLEHIVTFTPAWDRRSEGYGQQGVTLRMVAVGELGATEFVLSTMWALDELDGRGYARRERFGPIPADLGYHWRTQDHDYEMESHDCDVLGGVCFFDFPGLNAERVYERLIREGSDGVWAELHDYYDELAAR